MMKHIILLKLLKLVIEQWRSVDGEDDEGVDEDGDGGEDVPIFFFDACLFFSFGLTSRVSYMCVINFQFVFANRQPKLFRMTQKRDWSKEGRARLF